MKNYEAHYRPIIELAKQHRLPVNSRQHATQYCFESIQGKPLIVHYRHFTPERQQPVKISTGKILTTAMKGHGGMDDSDAGRLFFEAQCLKDDTMAESITDFLASQSTQTRFGRSSLR